MELDVCLRHSGDGDRGGVVLAGSRSGKRECGKSRGLREVLFFQSTTFLRRARSGAATAGVGAGGERATPLPRNGNHSRGTSGGRSATTASVEGGAGGA